MRPLSSIGIGSCSSSPISTSSTTTFEAKISSPVSGVHSTWISSPDLNCLRAAARTASLTASMTMSRSMPCSLQTASILCPMDALINFFVFGSGRPALALFRARRRHRLFSCYSVVVRAPATSRGALPFLCEPELFLNIYLQVRLGDLGEGDADAPRSLVVEEDVFALDPADAPAEVALPADGAARLHLRHLPREALVVAQPVEPALQTRRGDLQGVGAGDEVLDVEHGADVRAHPGAVRVGDAARLVDEDADDRRARPAGEFDVDEFDAALRARGGLYGKPARVATRQKEGRGRRAGGRGRAPRAADVGVKPRARQGVFNRPPPAAYCNLALTTSLTVRPSALRPARRACAAFITAPISFIVEAPVSAIASATACSISSRGAARGRYSSMTAISARSFSANSARPAFSYCSTESRRCLTSDWSTFVSSSSDNSPPFSISRFCTAAFTIRKVDSRDASFDFIAAVMSLVIRSFRVMA